ncbi:hypothetical protein FBU30_007670 [Linnemannia zychae]|nr:hypothetical protein FBU30_007670 [Linnemannia zychae]
MNISTRRGETKITVEPRAARNLGSIGRDESEKLKLHSAVTTINSNHFKDTRNEDDPEAELIRDHINLSKNRSQMQLSEVTGRSSHFSKSVHSRDRQMAIDGYFEPLSGKPGPEQYSQSNMYKKLLSWNHNQMNNKLVPSDILSQDVPVDHISYLESNEDSMIAYKTEELHDNNGYQGFVTPQTVPVMNIKTKAARSHITSRKRVESSKDPSTIYSGSIRLRSVLFARSIAQLSDTSEWTTDLSSFNRALVEITGRVVTPLQYTESCWIFAIQDCSPQDLPSEHISTTDIYSGSVPSSIQLPNMTKSHILQCLFYDIDNSLDQNVFDMRRVVRLVGILKPCSESERLSLNSQFKLLCVSVRNATIDEIKLAIHGGYRVMGYKHF